MCTCGAQEHGLVADLAVIGLQLNLVILKVFSILNDSKSPAQLCPLSAEG